MNNLMNELPSPNVTHILPINVANDYLPRVGDYNVISHGKGVFEFYPSKDTYTDNIRTALKEAFQMYAELEAVYPVNVTGLKTGDNDKAGSHRFCTMDGKFAKYLTDVINGRSVVDIISDGTKWMQMINVSKYFRFMKYASGGEHFPHYDSDYVYEYNKSATKYSLVVYFNDCDSGELAFVNDNTGHEVGCTDWDRQANNEEIWLKILPRCMKIVLFPHTLCHTVLPFTDQNNIRYICRGDILFNEVR